MKEILWTLVIAIVLVILVVYLFLQIGVHADSIAGGTRLLGWNVCFVPALWFFH